MAANFKRRAHAPKLALAYFMMSLSQKLESVSMNLPSPQCYVIDVIALPIDTDHFLKFIPECSKRN